VVPAIAGLLVGAAVWAEPPPRIAIIIDDLGYELDAGQRAVNLPGPVACAVLPSTPRARELARAAHVAGKEVLLHLPLQSEIDGMEQEPGVIRLDTTREQFARIFAESFESVPFAIGVNSHRGSLLTRHPGHMGWLMDQCARRPAVRRQLYDSSKRRFATGSRKRHTVGTARCVSR
jgi:uncharacterized protein